MVLVGAFVAVAAGCGSSHPPGDAQGFSSPAPTAQAGAPSPIANQQRTRAEASRLLRSVVAPPGSVKLASAPSSLLSAPVIGTPATTSLIDDSAFWRVPIPMAATLAWFVGHPPGGLARSGAGSSSSQGVTTSSGYSYAAPSSSAWTGASVELGVASSGPQASVLRADGMAIWIDPVPLRDSQPGLRMRITTESTCPADDRGFVGVTNPAASLNRSLLPPGDPTAGLVCAYYGSNGRPFKLERSKTLVSKAGSALALKLGQLPLGHVDGEAVNCPMDDGSATVVTLAYPQGINFDLWMATTGCATISNGHIMVSGSVPL